MKLTEYNTQLDVFAPGRINLIGEHIDYNGGFVLPSAIQKHIKISFRKNGTRICNIRSLDYRSGFRIDLEKIDRSNFQWHNYILGVIDEILKLNKEAISGFDCVIKSKLPIGSGVSSSAALECGMAKGLNELFAIGLSDEQIIQISKDAEHNYVGSKCGVMDQFAVVRGKKDTFIKLDCRTLEFDYISADLDPYKILLLNTNVSHNLSASDYNKRRRECTKALDYINHGTNKYDFLCEVPIDHLQEVQKDMPKTLHQRALYVVQENLRVLNTVKALTNKDFHSVGQFLYESHEGLKSLFEVSCEELDFMVDFSTDYPGVLGSRMMGGGFGGCTINLIHKDEIENYIGKISTAYYRRFNRELTPIPIALGDGVQVRLHH